MNTYIDISNKFDNRLFVEVLGEVAETRDAIDLGYLVREYLDLGNVERIYNKHTDLVEVDEFDYQIAGARLLVRDLAQICDRKPGNFWCRY
jgi:predicted nucleotidyltransferase